MEEILTDVNWIAVIVGTVVSFMIEWLWYSPKMFGTKCLEGAKVSLDNNSPMMHAMIAQFVGTFLFAWVISLTAATDSLLTAVLITLTIAVLIKANGLFAQKSTYVIRTEVGFILVMAAVMILAHAIL
ncbi:MAG: glycerol uptake facilitator-like aquaporin [Candidatus Azotimanducaceae bacterium]|jgi:glycerol uptake facilitator-like aquaporin